MNTLLNDYGPLDWLKGHLVGLLGRAAAEPRKSLDPLEQAPCDENTYAGAFNAHTVVADALHEPLLAFLARVVGALRQEGFVVGDPERELDSPSLTLSWVCGFGADERDAEDGDLVLGLSLCTESAPAGAASDHAARHDVYIGLGYLQTNENLVGERLEDAPQKTPVSLPAPDAGCALTLKSRIERIRALLDAADETALATYLAAALAR